MDHERDLPKNGIQLCPFILRRLGNTAKNDFADEFTGLSHGHIPVMARRRTTTAGGARMQRAVPIPTIWEERRKLACGRTFLAQGRCLRGVFALMAPGKKRLSEVLAEVTKLQHKHCRVHDFQAILLAV